MVTASGVRRQLVMAALLVGGTAAVMVGLVMADSHAVGGFSFFAMSAAALGGVSGILTRREAVTVVAQIVGGVAVIGVGVVAAAAVSRFAVLSDVKTLMVIVVIAGSVVMTTIGVVLVWGAVERAVRFRRSGNVGPVRL